MATSFVTNFIQNLSSEEIKVVKEYVNGSHKVEKLLTLLLDTPNKKFTDVDLSRLLESNIGAIRVLKSRLYNKVQEALISDTYLENSPEFTDREQILFGLKKKIMLIKSLYRKVNPGKFEAIYFLLSEVYVTASKYQCYDILIDSLTFQKYLKGVRQGIGQFEKINEEIIFYEDCMKSLRNANDDYYRLILNQEFTSSLSSNELNIFLKNSIQKMKVDYKRTKAHEINYFTYLLQMALHENEKNFHQAIILCKKLLELVKKNIVCYNKDRIGFALSNLTHFNILLNNYKEAISISKKAEKYYIQDSFNHLILKEQVFLAYFYDRNYSVALKQIKDMLLHSLSETGAFRRSKFLYYQAYTQFADGEYKDVIQLLNKSLEIEQDKAGWNIFLRILITMNFIELNKVNEANTSIENLRKYFNRIDKEKKIRQRDVQILQLLLELKKDGFKRNEKNKTAAKLIAELSDKDKPTAWNYFTPELIPFHEWVMTLPVKTA